MTCGICNRARCRRCREHLADMLDPANTGSVFNADKPASIPVLYSRLDAAHTVTGLIESGPGGFGPSSPGNDHILALRDPRSRRTGGYGPDDDGDHGPRPAHTVLYAIARQLDERDISGLATHLRLPATVPGLAAWLWYRLDDLLAAPWIGSAYRHLTALSGQLRAANGDPTHVLPVTCQQLVDADGHKQPDGPWRCAWPLFMPSLPPRAPDEPLVVPAVRCGCCGHRYTGAELMELGRPNPEETQVPA